MQVYSTHTSGTQAGIPIRQAAVSHIQTVLEFRDLTAAALRVMPMTYKALAEKTNITATTIGRLASGETKEPRLSTCLKILLELGYKITVTRG